MPVTRDELVSLAKKIRHANAASEAELDADIELFENNVPDPEASDYFFSKRFENMTVEEIVDKALSYKPYLL